MYHSFVLPSNPLASFFQVFQAVFAFLRKKIHFTGIFADFAAFFPGYPQY